MKHARKVLLITILVLIVGVARSWVPPAWAVVGEGNAQYRAPESCPLGTFLYLSQHDNIVEGECLSKNPFLQPQSLCWGTGDVHVRTFFGANFDYEEVLDASFTVRSDHLMEVQTRLRPIDVYGVDGVVITAVAFKYNGVDAFAYDGASRQMLLNGLPFDLGESLSAPLPRGGQLRVIDDTQFEIRATNGTRLVVMYNQPSEGEGFFLNIFLYVLTEDLVYWTGLCNQDVIFFAYPSYLPSTPPPTTCEADRTCVRAVAIDRSTKFGLVSARWQQLNPSGEGRLKLKNKHRLWLGVEPGVVVPQSVPVLPEGMAHASLIPPHGSAAYRIAFTAPGQRVPIVVSPWTHLARLWNLLSLVLHAGGLDVPKITDPAPLAWPASGGAGTAEGCLDSLVTATDFAAYQDAGECVVASLRAAGIDQNTTELLAIVLPGHHTAEELKQVFERAARDLRAETVAQELWDLAQPTFDKPFVGVTVESVH